MAEAGSTGATTVSPMPRGLVVVLGVTGLLVTTLALQQFSSIVAPVLLALVLVIGWRSSVHLRRYLTVAYRRHADKSRT